MRVLLLALVSVTLAAGCAARSSERLPGRPEQVVSSQPDRAGGARPQTPTAETAAALPPRAETGRPWAPTAETVGALPGRAETIGALPPPVVRQIAALLEAKAARTPAQRKIGSQLLAQTAGAAGGPVPAELLQAAGAAPGAVGPAERVLVDIRADVTPAVLDRLGDLGGTVVNSVPRYRSIRAGLPLGGLERLAELDAVQSIRIADEPQTRTEPRQSLPAGRSDPAASAVPRKADTSEGDRAHRADAARSTHGVDGTGIGVGVLSDGVDSLSAQQATGDVPAHVTVLPGQAGGAFPYSCGRRSFGSEGTAMFEIVHDLAPGAELFFATGGGGPAQMAQNIEDLCEAGADVIVDDVGYLLAPAFQDGVIGQAVSTVTAQGCHYFSSAGNGGSLYHGTSSVWEGDFAAGPAFVLNGVDVGVAHDFGGGASGNRIVKDSTLPIILQWADPWGASENDYDLFLIDADDNVVAFSTNTQDGSSGSDPIEYIGTSCADDRVGTRLLIVRTTGAADRHLRLSYAREGLATTTSGQTFGHSASENAVGVAAVDARAAQGAGGVFDGSELVETFSSDGPRRIFFEADGTAITPGNFSSTGGRVLEKPDLTAADGVSTSTPGFDDFHGTSAAAPHAAAIAALMVEAAGGPAKVTPAGLRTAMTGNALDIMAPGPDFQSGAGIVMAPRAVDAVDVAVADRNRAPTAASPPADRTFEPGADAVTIDLADVFADPNSDTLTYTLQLSRDDPAVTLAGSVLTLAPAGPGTPVVVTVRATDPDGLTRALTFTVTVTAGDRDYDTDDDNLIDIANLAQLDAARYDLNGDGSVDGATWRPYYEAFEDGATGMGCPEGCAGYELTADLDFDTDGSGVVDAGDDYWNAGAGWEPIGDRANPFDTTLEGNRRTISHLFIDGGDFSGLFGETGSASVISRLGLVDADVTAEDYVGGLVGDGSGEIRSSYVTGRVSGGYAVGGLIGRNAGAVSASYATAGVTADDLGGGLAGQNAGNAWIRACYATGRVSGDDSGGLVGLNNGTVAASYATGRVLGGTDVGGLAGAGDGVFRASYWDRETSGVRVGLGEDDLDNDGWLEGGESRTPGIAGLSTAVLQAPTGYDGIYGTWNIDLDGDLVPDIPWFLLSAGYPILSSYDYAAGGYQLQEGPTLAAATSAGQAQVTLTWTALDASRFWLSGPDITYNLIRDDGATFELLVEESGELQYTDTGVTAGTTYTYQVAAVVQGGEATRSAALAVVAGAGNQPPAAVGTLADRTLRAGGSAVSVDVAGAFLDPEGDTLDYAASSSATAVAAAGRSGTQVTIAPVAAGEATITVTATDTGGSNTGAVQRFKVTVWSATAVDYDTDDDGLIEIRTPRQLDAVRHDPDGDGTPAAGGAASYRAAFVAAVDRLGCAGSEGCTGYELAADLDFDTNANGVADAGDAYWNGGLGWTPIGSRTRPFAATFDGNGRTIANLFIDGIFLSETGLFGVAGPTSVIRGVGLTHVAVQAGADAVGGLVGENHGVIAGSFVAGRVAGDDFVGGLAGYSRGVIAASYATARVAGDLAVGGLAGVNSGAVVAGYATGSVEGRSGVGGVVGLLYGGRVDASYATGRVSGAGNVGGLVGSIASIGGDVTAGYWDTRTSGLASGEPEQGQGQSTAALQGPGGYTGLYRTWEVDLDGDRRRESPWHFGTGAQYPALALDVDGNGQATWQEMGHQLREGPTLTVSAQPAEAALTWTPVVASHWTPEPVVRYTVVRDDGVDIEILAEDVGDLEYTDTAVTAGTTYTYQVAAAVAGGEATWSAPVTPGGGGRGGGGGGRNRAPEAVGALADRMLETGARPLSVDVAPAFRDPDGDVLTYEAESSSAGVAAVSVAASVLTVAPVSVGEVVITVTATDAEGSNRSALQIFAVTVVCGFAVAPAHRDVLWTAGTEQVAVTTVPGCTWTAASESDFVTLTAGSAGTGAGVATYTVAQNAGGPRTGILTVAGQRVTVFQASPTVFADHPIQPGVTPVRAIHFRELRARIDALRVDRGLAGYDWTDPDLRAGVTQVRLVHLTDLQTALAETHVAAGRAAPIHPDKEPTAGVTGIQAAHVMELRAAVVALE